MNTTAHHSPPRFSEYSPERRNKSTAEIQADIQLMRLAYAERRSLNHHRHEAMIGYGLLAVALGVPVIAAAIALLF